MLRGFVYALDVVPNGLSVIYSIILNYYVILIRPVTSGMFLDIPCVKIVGFDDQISGGETDEND